MKILIVNTSDNQGGAATAAFRLMEALNNNGHKAKMLVRDKNTSSITVAKAGEQKYSKWHFLYERLSILTTLRGKKNNLFAIDIANSGIDITKTREFQEADVIHLHWINQGMLSLNGIRKILESDKPVVWTMHDLWPASSICHYARGCTGFTKQCGNCPLLPGSSKNDLSHKVWKRKEAMLENKGIQFVTCSKWLMQTAKQSSLIKDQKIQSIPNPIDTMIFRPQGKQKAREVFQLPKDKKVILFASQKVSDERKGGKYLLEALEICQREKPNFKDECVLAILGAKPENLPEDIQIPAYHLGYISDTQKIVSAYNAADIFVLPSLEDNLPNTIMEALACGLPCAAFKTGGIPEMIDNGKNGYTAQYKDSQDLAKGIITLLYSDNYKEMSSEAVKKVIKNYSQSAVALKYTEVYNAAIAQKHYNL